MLSLILLSKFFPVLLPFESNTFIVSQAQVSSYATADEDKDTDALIEDEPIQQEEACDQPSETDRLERGCTSTPNTKCFYGYLMLFTFPENKQGWMGEAFSVIIIYY